MRIDIEDKFKIEVYTAPISRYLLVLLFIVVFIVFIQLRLACIIHRESFCDVFILR